MHDAGVPIRSRHPLGVHGVPILDPFGSSLGCSSTRGRGPPLPAELQAAVEEVLPALQHDGIRVFYLSSTSPTPGVEALLPAIEEASDEPLPAHHRAGITHESKALYIYTSGTTGEVVGTATPSKAGGAAPWRTAMGRVWV